MAFIPIPNCVEVVITWTGGAKPFKTVLNVTGAVAWTIALAENLATRIVDVIVNNGLAWISSSFAAALLTMTDMSSSSGFSFNWTAGTGANVLPKAATGSATLTFADSALVTTLRTLNRGRSFRGRNYWPGVPASQVAADGAHLSGTRITAQQSFVTDLIAAIITVSGQHLVVASRFAGGAPRVSGITTQVSSIDTNNVIDSQRRRTQV